jgi:hypothetical protein
MSLNSTPVKCVDTASSILLTVEAEFKRLQILLVIRVKFIELIVL